MKKILTTMTICLLMIINVFVCPVHAASASASMTGPSTVRANDTITVNFVVNGQGVSGLSGNLSYDGNKVTLVSTKQVIGAPWAVEFNGNTVVSYDNNLTLPLNGSKTIFSATFKVKALNPGDNISVSMTNITATDGSADINVPTATYSKSIAAPLSGDNTLKGLTVSNATLSSAFSSSTTAYTTSVPFEVDKLAINAVANDPKAKVSISNNQLAPKATTTVSIVVKAENGSTKTYTIAATRPADPNYVPSSNNTLTSLSVDGYVLSPKFDANVNEYIVWLPYETESISVSGVCQDPNASISVVGGDTLEAGKDNEVKVVVKAENGSEKEYKIIAKRAPAHDADNSQEVTPPPANTNIVGYVVVFVLGLAAGVILDKKVLKNK